MSRTQTQWQQWSMMFAAFSLRERIITTITLLVGGGFLLLTYLVEPLQIKAVSAKAALAAAQAEIPQQEAMLLAIKSAPVDPDVANRQRLAQAKDQLTAVSEWLKQFETSLVSPREVPELLEGVLVRNPRVELLSMTKLAPVPIGSANESPQNRGVKTGGPPGEGIYKHTIELSLAGSYNDLLNYTFALERLPQRLMWTSSNIKVAAYPRTVMVLRVYTMSFESNWLQL